MRTILLFFLLGLTVVGQAQSPDMAQAQNPEPLLYSLRQAVLSAREDEARKQANTQFIEELERALSTKAGVQHPYDSLGLTMAVLTPPDTAFRIFNWNLPSNDGTHQFFCYITRWDAKAKKYTVKQLQDKSAALSRVANRTLTAKNWYGALYFEIIPVRAKQQPYYVLLGWDGNDKQSQKKVIDVLTFQGNRPSFGLPVFKTDEGMSSRVFFEYSAQATLSLKYHPKEEMIVFNELVPRQPDLAGLPQFYVPDLRFNSYALKKGKWFFVANVSPEMPARTDLQVPWTDPSDPEAEQLKKQ